MDGQHGQGAMPHNVALADASPRTDGLKSEICLVVHDGHSVVIASKPGYPVGCFRLPTGGMEPDESPLEAAQRELLEELGHRATIELIGTISYGDKPATVFTTWMAAVRLGELNHLSPADDELSEVVNIPITDLGRIANALEELPDLAHRGTTWKQWGEFRAVAHRFAQELLVPTNDREVAR